MEHTIKKLPKSQIEITGSLSAEEFNAFKETALDELSQKITLEGFRPGKAPREMVKDKIGADELRQLAIEKAIQHHYEGIARKEKLDIIGHPDARITKEEPELEFTIVASIFPEITLPDYAAIAKNILKEKKEIVIEEKEIEDSIKWIRESRAKYVTVTRGAGKGDQVEVDFEVRDNGVTIEGGLSKNHPLVIGEGRFVPGFEDELIGMKEKEEKKFSLTMPKEYPNNLGGKKLDFSVTVNLVQERILPELNDEFAKGIGKFESTEELKKNVREGIEKEKEEKERQRIDMKIADEIATKAKIEIPEFLTDREVEKMMIELKGGISRMGMEFDKYLEQIKKSPEDLKKDWRGEAEKRVAVALALREIAAKEKLEPSEEEITAKANNSLDVFKAEGHDVEKIDKAALADYSRSILRNEKVFEFLENQK